MNAKVQSQSLMLLSWVATAQAVLRDPKIARKEGHTAPLTARQVEALEASIARWRAEEDALWV